MLRSLIHGDVWSSFQSIRRCTKFIQSSYHSKRCCSTPQNHHDSNQLTLDYAQLLEYVRPEMAQRIQQLLDHDNYLFSLSQQIQEKKTYHESLEKTQKHKEPAPHNQRLSKQVMQSLQHNNNDDTETNVPQYEPGLNLQEFSSIKSLQSTFYGASPLRSFADFENMDKYLIKAINDIGITIPSHIQQLAIPEMMKGNNCVIGAETGTGKTIAFVLPILQKMLGDKRMTEARYSPLTNRENHGVNDKYEKHHPFEYDAEKKHPPFVIITPNEHLSKQTQKVMDEILGRYYDNIYYENRNNRNFYKLKTMSLHGRALLPKSNELMPDILVTTPTALLTNLHKKHNENRFRSFLSKIKYIVLDEADYLTRSSSRSQIQYVFAKLRELRKQIENNPLKYKLLLPQYLREEAYGATSSSIFRELNEMAKPQIAFVGATIPTEGSKNVAETVRHWLDKAVWIRTPGLHDVGTHIAQEFRFVPREMELDILHQVLIALAREHLYKTLWLQSDEDLLNKEEQAHDNEMGKDKKKRKRRAKRVKNSEDLEWQNKQKQFHILIFVNSKKFTRECYKYLLDAGWFNTRCIHSQLHREERKQRLADFENSVSCANNEMSDNIKRRNIAINEQIGDKEDENVEYKEVVNNVHLLVTSDFANRGVDFKNVDVVINCQFPKNAIDYLHRCGRTGRGAAHSNLHNGKVLSFFSEYDLDLAWHIQMALINQYKSILSNIEESTAAASAAESGEYMKRVGTNNVKLDDCFGIEEDKLSLLLKSNRGYNRFSVPRDYEKAIDLTRCDLDEMDEKVLSHILKYAKDEKWITKKQDTKENKLQLQLLINERKEQKRKLKMPWPFHLELEFANE